MTLPLHANDPIILNSHTSPVCSVTFSPSDQILASGASDDTVRLWNTESGADIATLNGHSATVRSVAFSPDGTILASGSSDKTIKLWDMRSWEHLATLEGHSNWVWSVSFSPDGSRLVSGSGDETIRLWDLKSRTNISILKGHSNYVWSVVFSPDGRRLASGSRDITVRLWDVTSGENTATLQGHSREVWTVRFSPSGEYLATGADDRTIRLWNAATGAHIATMRGHSHLIRSLAFSPDSIYLASASDDYTIKLWNVASRSHISTLKGHTSSVNSVAFSPNGTHIASASDDKTARIWKISLDQYNSSWEQIGRSTSTTDDQHDTNISTSDSAPLNNDITGSVDLQGGPAIAYGGFGDLFLGIHINHGHVALKKPRKLFNEALFRRLLREIDLWCSVSHPNILPCLGMCRIGPDVYIVSPFIENGDLLSCMVRGMDLNRSKLLFEVADALTHLHHRGIIHGDVKAQNVLVENDGTALLCDFGLAKAFDTMATSTEVKGAGSVRWMAPELFRDASRSMATDVYSFGITIAEVLSGYTPYPSISENVAVVLHVAYDEGRPAKEPMSSPEGKSYATLWETAEKCWVKEAKERPNMAQVLGMLFPLTRDMA